MIAGPRRRVSWPLDQTDTRSATLPGVTAEKLEPARAGDWIITASGKRFYPLDPRPEDISLDDIATALSKLCRWGGHLNIDGIFSVAQHCVLVALNCPHRFRAQALLHDAHEAYLVDVPRPIKRYLVNYEIFAARLDACIGDRFCVELCDLPREVDEADDRGLATERRDLLVPWPCEPGEPQGSLVKPWPARISPWEPAEARRNFLGLAHKLGIK
jgi:hypothetical protein